MPLMKFALVWVILATASAAKAGEPQRFLWGTSEGSEHYFGVAQGAVDCNAMAAALTIPRVGTVFYCRSNGAALATDVEHHRLVAVSTKGDSERDVGVFRGCHAMAGLLNIKWLGPKGEVGVCR
jgi:hypothetical protein